MLIVFLTLQLTPPPENTLIYIYIYYCIISQTLNQVLLSHVFFPYVCKFSEDKVTMPLQRQTQVTSVINVVLEVLYRSDYELSMTWPLIG